MKFKTLLLPLALAIGFMATVEAQAEVLYSLTNGSVDISDPTQAGRLSRNGVPQCWDQDAMSTCREAYPGFINTGTNYRYHTYSFNSAAESYLEFTLDSPSLNVFFAAYLATYTPGNASAALTWLGDEGSSGDLAFNSGVPAEDVRTFQVKVPAFSTVLLVANNTAANFGGVGDKYNVVVDGYIDTQYNDLPNAVTSVPEPATLLLLGPVALLAGLKTCRRSPALSA